MSPLANLLTRGKEDADPTLDVSDLPVRATVVARVNLLPREIAEADRFRREQVVRGAVVAAAVVVVGALAVGAMHSVSQAQAAVAATTARSAQLNQQVAQLSIVPQTAAALTTAQTARAGALGQEVRWSEYLNNLGLIMPNGVELQSMTVTQSVDPSQTTSGTSTTGVVGALGTPGIATVEYTGIAASNQDVAFFITAIGKQLGDTDPYFTSAATTIDPVSGRPVVAFAASVTTTDAILSGRYSKVGN